MNDITRRIYNCGIVPTVKISDPNKAVPTARALYRGGIDIVEIVFRTDAAEEAIRRISAECPEVLVGAGTVLTTAQVDAAVNAGAKFIVTPGFNPDTVKYCVAKNIPIVPGAITPGEMEQAMALGLDTVKFFPAEASGGIPFLKAVAGPYKSLKFMPTGGIDEKNLASYTALPNVVACGGSFPAKESLIEAEDYDAITRIAAETMKKMLGFEIKHIGINSADEKEAAKTADALSLMLGLEKDDRAGATFVGTLFEVLKKPFRGTCGHIAVSTNSPDRARAYLERLGFEFDESSASYDEAGRLKVVYFKDEFGKFAFHLIKK